MADEVKTTQTEPVVETQNDNQEFNFETEKFLGGKYKDIQSAEQGFKSMQREMQKILDENKKLKGTTDTLTKIDDKKDDKSKDKVTDDKVDDKTTEDKDKPKDEKLEPKNDLEKLANVADNTLSKAGLSLAKYQEEYNKNGNLSEDSISEIASKTNISKEDLIEFIDIAEKTRGSSVEKQEQEIYEMSGGFDNAQKIGKWAGITAQTDKTLKDYVDIFNDSQDFAQVKIAWEAINARYAKIFGQPPKVTIKGESGFSAGNIFNNKDEYLKAVKDPRYKTDAKYRAEVDAILERSTYYKS
jgi:hypothetical protein